MIKINSLVVGLSILFFLPNAAEAVSVNTNSNKGFGKFLLVQFGTTPTYNQRQQEAFNRDSNNYQSWLYYQRQQRQQAEYNRQENELARLERIRQAQELARNSIPELESKKDYLALGQAWRTLEEWDRSLDAANKAIAAYPNIVAGYTLRASLRKRLNDVAGAIADYDRAIAIEPDYHGYYRLRGKLKKSFDRDGAIQDFRMAMKAVRVDNRYNLIRDSELKILAKELQSLGATE
jgi:tetratricopeptide (TPR) repeat protein